MPTTVHALFRDADVPLQGCVPWGEPPPLQQPGVYVVSLSDDPTDLASALPTAPLDDQKLALLLARRPELRLDGARPDVAQLAARLGACWLPDETVVYIGMTTATVRKRVGTGPDKERSGVLGVGRQPLADLVQVGERLVLRRGDAGVITLD